MDTRRRIAEYAADRGGACVALHSNERTLAQVTVKCAKGHTWTANPQILLKGGWCPKCGRARPKLTLADMHAAAQENGGKCLSTFYKNSEAKLLWECAEGHRWMTNAHTIRKGAWCPRCKADSQKNTIADMVALAAKHGGRCISKQYINNATPLLWKCDRGHRWKAQPANITMGEWCPTCAHERHRLKLDDLKKLARSRKGKCLATHYHCNDEKLLWECAEGHRWKAQTNNVRSGSWCPQCARNQPYTIEDMHKLARKFGGTCLSKSYKNGRTPLRWKCEMGHIFEKTPNHIINQGQWCRACGGTQPHSIRTMREAARSYGGRCLSTEYANNRTALKWRCKQGHVFMKTAKLVLNRRQWCPDCSRAKKRER